MRIPPGCILNPGDTAAVVGGNVLTSQRVTDVVLRAFTAAAASQVGCVWGLAVAAWGGGTAGVAGRWGGWEAGWQEGEIRKGNGRPRDVPKG